MENPAVGSGGNCEAIIEISVTGRSGGRTDGDDGYGRRVTGDGRRATGDGRRVIVRATGTVGATVWSREA